MKKSSVKAESPKYPYRKFQNSGNPIEMAAVEGIVQKCEIIVDPTARFIYIAYIGTGDMECSQKIDLNDKPEQIKAELIQFVKDFGF